MMFPWTVLKKSHDRGTRRSTRSSHTRCVRGRLVSGQSVGRWLARSGWRFKRGRYEIEFVSLRGGFAPLSLYPFAFRMSIDADSLKAAAAAADLSKFDDEQVKFMEEEYIIVVDNDDKVIGKESKKTSTSHMIQCHYRKLSFSYYTPAKFLKNGVYPSCFHFKTSVMTPYASHARAHRARFSLLLSPERTLFSLFSLCTCSPRHQAHC